MIEVISRCNRSECPQDAAGVEGDFGGAAPLGGFEVGSMMAGWKDLIQAGRLIGLALILTFSPWETEQQGPRWECRMSWRGRAVRVNQAQSNRVKPGGLTTPLCASEVRNELFLPI